MKLINTQKSTRTGEKLLIELMAEEIAIIQQKKTILNQDKYNEKILEIADKYTEEAIRNSFNMVFTSPF